MPRGVYDRSAAKAKKTAKAVAPTTSTATEKPKRKYTKRADKVAAAQVAFVSRSSGSLDEVQILTHTLEMLCAMKGAGHNIVDPIIKKTVKALETAFDSVYGEVTVANGLDGKSVASLPVPEKFTVNGAALPTAQS